MNLVLALLVGWVLLSLPLGLATAALLRGGRHRSEVVAVPEVAEVPAPAFQPVLGGAA